jgi:hypothetical protein
MYGVEGYFVYWLFDLATPNIHILDMSNNEIVLNQENVNFLTHTRKLTQVIIFFFLIHISILAVFAPRVHILCEQD